MVVGTGFEPVERFLQVCEQIAASVGAETTDTQLRTQKLAESSSETMSNVEWLREVIEAWPKLSTELRMAVLAVTRTAGERRGHVAALKCLCRIADRRERSRGEGNKVRSVHCNSASAWVCLQVSRSLAAWARKHVPNFAMTA